MSNMYSLINFYEIADGAEDGLYFDMYSFAFNDFPDFIYDKNCEVMVINDMQANTPDLIAYQKYGDERLFWVVCLANKISDPFEELPCGKQIALPNISDVNEYILKKRLSNTTNLSNTNNKVISLN